MFDARPMDAGVDVIVAGLGPAGGHPDGRLLGDLARQAAEVIASPRRHPPARARRHRRDSGALARFHGAMDDTRLSAARYLDLLHEEGERLLLAAEGAMDRPVPACDGWTVRDVVEHVGMVYGHKIAALELGRRPEPGEWAGPGGGRRRDRVVPRAPAPPGDRPVPGRRPRSRRGPGGSRTRPRASGSGGWRSETAVHRADVESASGPVTPIARRPRGGRHRRADARHARRRGVDDVAGPMRAGDRVRVVVTGTAVSGDASDVLLWLWGRAPSGAVRSSTGRPSRRSAPAVALPTPTQ